MYKISVSRPGPIIGGRWAEVDSGYFGSDAEARQWAENYPVPEHWEWVRFDLTIRSIREVKR